MLVIKAESWPGGAVNAAKEIGCLKIISQNPFDLTGTQISSYTYEMADPGTAAFPLKGIGRVQNHFRQQPVWMLVQKVIADMGEHGLLMPQQTSGENREDRNQIVVFKAQIWESGYDRNALEIGRVRIVTEDDSHAWELQDPPSSNLALAGAGSVVGEFHTRPAWALLEKTIEDMHARNILSVPHDGNYAVVGRAWLDLALREPAGPNATTHFRAALNAYAFAFQNATQLTAGLREVVETLSAARRSIDARGDRGIDSRFAWVVKHGLDLCGPDDPLRAELESLHEEQKAAYLASKKGTTGLIGFFRRFLAAAAD